MPRRNDQSRASIINSLYNYNCTFNPMDKLMEVIEKNEKLYKNLLKEKDDKIGMLQKVNEGKK